MTKTFMLCVREKRVKTFANAHLGVFLYRGTSPPPSRKGPLYRKKTTHILGCPAVITRAALAASSRVDVDLNNWQLVASVPTPSRSPLPDRDLNLARGLVKSFLDQAHP